MLTLFSSRKTIRQSNLLWGMTDVHSHLLPGVDDGVQSMEESLQILAEYERLGVKEVWFTPHVMEDIPNTTEGLKMRFAELKATYQGSVMLHLASENMLDNLFEERLEKNDLLPIGKDGKHVLVETSYFNPPMGLNNILLRIKAKGYYPVLAHPERYLYMNENDYQQLSSMGIEFQLNQFSLFGLYGTEVQKRAKTLQKHGMYNYIGTDLHQIITLQNALRVKL